MTSEPVSYETQYWPSKRQCPPSPPPPPPHTVEQSQDEIRAAPIQSH